MDYPESYYEEAQPYDSAINGMLWLAKVLDFSFLWEAKIGIYYPSYYQATLAAYLHASNQHVTKLVLLSLRITQSSTSGWCLSYIYHKQLNIVLKNIRKIWYLGIVYR